jgi:hypothetical protein
LRTHGQQKRKIFAIFHVQKHIGREIRTFKNRENLNFAGSFDDFINEKPHFCENM